MMNRAMMITITAFLTTTLLATEVFGLGIFRKHRCPLKKSCKKPLVKKSVQPTLPITLAFDSLKSLEENGPVYILQYKLFNTGLLELSMFLHEDRFDHSQPGEPHGKTTILLTKKQMYLALQQVKIIANTPLNIQKNENRCGVIPSIDKGTKSLYSVRNYNVQYNTFSPGLKLVENLSGCWAKYSVSPQENQSAFRNLRNLLINYGKSSIVLLTQ